MKIKLAILSKYGDKAASTRHRFDQFIPFLENEGFEIIKKPLFSNDYLNKLYLTNKRSIYRIVSSYLNRLFWLLSKKDIDLIWLHCDLFPYMPSIFEKILVYQKKPIIHDFDDAIFHNYDLSPKWVVRKFLGKKLHCTISQAKISLCGNEYLANYARPLCPNTKVLPTVVDTKIFYPDRDKNFNNYPLKIGWIGTPTTFKQYLKDIIPVLKLLCEEENCKILVMGAGKELIDNNSSIEFFEWNETNEVNFIRSLDIGIMPLNNLPWSKGKCGFKLIQYMACGVPVVASPIGANNQIIDHGLNGFFANSEKDWIKSLKILIKDNDLRRKMGLAGRKKIEKNFSLKVWGPVITKIINNIYRDGHIK